jgi:peptidoglycan/LPS O-acetylase OafA/YrhL
MMSKFYRGVSLGQRMGEAGGHPSGFDYMRLILALSVIFFHSIAFTGSAASMALLYQGPLDVWRLSIVPMFFGLSGFLVAGSIDRTRSLIGFAGLRFLRIFPALTVDTFFSAFVLGLCLTTLPWHSYFGAPEFRRYFLNIVGDIHYTLPGVFHTLPRRAVNIQLWTIPFELKCYAILIALAAAGLFRRRRLFLAAAVVVLVASPVLFGLLGWGWSNPQCVVVPSFLAGCAAYLYRDDIAWNGWLCGLAVAAMTAIAAIPILVGLLPVPLIYATVFLGLLNPRKIWLLKTGDYSYGVYLYGSPFIQTLIATFPPAHAWYVNFLLAVPVTLVFAALSWHLVEKNCLALKPRLFRLEDRILASMGRRPPDRGGC